MPNVPEELVRTALLIGEDGVEKLKKSHVCVFGAGGVGGYVIEALARAGVGTLTIVDKDVVNRSNINRQIIALQSTVGKPKVEAFKERIADIFPSTTVYARETFFLPENAGEFDFSTYDYVVDAVDTVTAKIEIIKRAKEAGTRVISSMGTGNKTNASKFVITDISKTSVCPLAKVMRRELKNRGIKDVKVLFSTEEVLKGQETVASISFVPSVAGLLIAGEVVRDLLAE